MDAQMPRRQDGEEGPGRHPSGVLRSSEKPAQKELGIFDPSNTFLLFPTFPVVLGGVQSQLASYCWLAVGARTAGESLRRLVSETVLRIGNSL